MATNNYMGENFLNFVFKGLSKEEVVRNCSNPKDNKNVRVRKYLAKLRYMHDIAKNNGDGGLELLRAYYYKKYVIKEDKFPKKYIDVRKKVASNMGYGDIKLSEEHIKEIKKDNIEDQKKSLDRWIDFLLEENSYPNYPDWYKYYVFEGIVKIGSYDKSKNKINKRTATTSSVFVGLNEQALLLIYINLVKVLKGEKIEDLTLQKLLKDANFGKIYLYMLNKLNNNEAKDGIWKKYNRQTNNETKEEIKLVNDIQGKITNWCIEGKHSAHLTLRDGDVYIYYTKDMNDNYACPRIGMSIDENGTIDEIRGTAYNQDIEEEMKDVLKKKLFELPDGNNYIKKDSDMKKLTKLYNSKDKEFSVEELKFLYEIDAPINGFDIHRDSRINEILSTRNWKEDFSKISGCSVEDIKNKIKKI